MIFKQKYGRLRTVFDFRPDDVAYQVKDGMTTRRMVIPYETIKFANPVKRQRGDHWGVFLIKAVLMVCAVVASVFAVEGSVDIPLMFCIGIAILALCYYIYQAIRIGYTSFATAKGNMLILHDRNYDQVMEQLKNHFSNRLHNLYGEIDFSNDYEHEIRRFQTMKELEIITDDDYREAFGKIRDRIRLEKLAIDINACPEDEINKFNWMYENNIISEEEYRAIVQDINAQCRGVPSQTVH